MGQDPQDFYDANIRCFQWRQQVDVDPEFARFLDTMVATQAQARYPSAQRALRELEQLSHLQQSGRSGSIPIPAKLAKAVAPLNPPATEMRDISEVAPQVTQHTVVAEPIVPQPSVVTKVGNQVQLWMIRLLQYVLILGAIATLLSGVIWAIRERLDTTSSPSSSPTTAPKTPSAPPLSREELARKARLFDRMDALGVPSTYFSQITNEAFFLEYPEYQGRALTRSQADAPLREQWDEVGFQVLEVMGKLAPEARDRIGQYSLRDRQRIDTQLRSKKVNRRRFYQQVDEKLVDDLSMYREIDLRGKRAQQLWFAIVQDRFLDIEDD